MTDTRFLNPKLVGAGMLGLASTLLVACGADSGSSSSPQADNPPLGGDAKSVEGPLDPVQAAVIDDLLASAIASSLPAPAGPAVTCLSDALNALVDAPDALLAGLTTIPSGADPVSSLQGAGDQVTGSLQNFAALTQASLMMLTGQQTDCAGSGAPAGSNPLAGTPLEPVGAALADLTGALALAENSDEDPDLRPLADTLAPVLMQLSGAFDEVPPEVHDAPVVGGLFTTLQGALDDLAATMPAVGAYDPDGTQAGTETLLNNLLSNVLLGVLPVEDIDEQTGQDFSGQIRGGIDQATAALGDGLGQLVTPLFNDLLNGALEPVLDPVEGLLAQLLNPAGLSGANPLDGLLVSIINDGTGTPLDALLAMLTAGASGNTLDDLTALLGGNTGGSPLDQITGLLDGGGLPLDALLGQLAQGGGALPVLGDLGGLLGG